MHVRPVRLNAAVAGSFALGSTCFVVGSVPAFVTAVGGWVDGVTYFVGSIFFTLASYGQLVQVQSPAMTGVDDLTQHVPAPLRWIAWSPHDMDWWAAITQFPGTLFFNVSTFASLAHNATVQESNRHVWIPDLYGSILFLVASTFALLAVGRARDLMWKIGWLNMVGSILFMASALASYVLPSGELVSTRISVAGTLLGALCFLIGAVLMVPAWRRSVSGAEGSTRIPHDDVSHTRSESEERR